MKRRRCKGEKKERRWREEEFGKYETKGGEGRGREG